MCVDETLQGRGKLLALLAMMLIVKKVPACRNHRVDMAVPLGTGIVLEREPTELSLVSTLVFVIALREAGKTQVSETKRCEFALNCLLIDMLILDDVTGYC